MTTTPELPPKKEVMLALLQRSSVYIHLDPRNADVRVPAWFKKQPQLVLQVGLNLAVRIPDLDVGDDAVSCTLSFSRSPFFCYMPWSAVFALVAEDGKGMLWPKDIPPEVAAQQAERAQKDQVRERVRPVAVVPAVSEAESGPTANANLQEAGAKASTPTAGGTGKKRGATRLRAQKTEKNPSSREPSSATGAPRPAGKTRLHDREPARPTPAAESKRPLPPYLRVVK